MSRNLTAFALLLSFLAFAMGGTAFSGEPQEQLRQTTDKVLAILSDPSLRSPERARERREMILKVIEERFDW